MKYLSRPNRPIYERIYWVLTLLVVYFAVVYVIIDQVQMFLKNPVLITFSSYSTPVEEIPFPAVTICTENQVRPTIVNLTYALKNIERLSPAMRQKYEYAAHVCRINYTSVRKAFDKEIITEMIEAVNGLEICKRTIHELKWSSRALVPPCRYLQPTVSLFGGCLSFNMLPLAHIFRNSSSQIVNDWAKDFWTDEKVPWSPDRGFETNGSFPSSPPWKTTGSNMANSVIFDLKLLSDDFDGICSRDGQGFFVYVHNPSELPSGSYLSTFIEDNRDTVISVTPKFYITNPSLHGWAAEQRGCFFQAERTLMYFRIYTQHNCDLECLTNITIQNCQCTPFHLPRTTNATVCGLGKLKCLLFTAASTGDTSSQSTCNCLPSCSELQYEVQVSKAKRNWSKDHFHFDNDTYTVLKVKFQQKFFVGIMRTVMFSLSDFIANVGGILGLFLGFSMLSIAEIIYFILLRPCRNYLRRRKLKKLKQVQDQILFHNTFLTHKVIGYPETVPKNKTLNKKLFLT